VHTNDPLMWYWEFERKFFVEDGTRKKRSDVDQDWTEDEDCDLTQAMMDHLLDNVVGAAAGATDSDGRAVKQRKTFYAQGQGTYSKTATRPSSTGKIDVAMLKPYLISGNGDHFPRDKIRIFGKAISNAQPYEMVDIMLSRQSI
jgi:hypothetical protein